MRDYDPTTGRYIQADPLGLVDGASVYNYVRSNPARYVDPRGELTLVGGAIAGGAIGGPIGAIGGAALGGAIGYFGGKGAMQLLDMFREWRERKGDWRVNVRCHVKIFDDSQCEKCPSTVGGWANGKTFAEAFSGAQMDANENLGAIGARGCHPRHCQPVACYLKGKRVACPKSGR